MARPRLTVPPRPDASFVFSEAAVAAFREMCGVVAASSIATQLQTAVIAYFTAPAEPQPPESRHRREFQRLHRAIRRTLQTLESFSPSARRRFQTPYPSGSLGALMGLVDTRARLDALRQSAVAAARALEFERGRGRRRGRPIDRDRRHLARTVGLVLARLEIPLVASRDGVLARVLAHVLFEVYTKAPQTDSLFPLIRYARDFVRNVPQTDREEMFELGCRRGMSLVDMERSFIYRRSIPAASVPPPVR